MDFSLEGFPNFRLINTYFPTETTERLEFLRNFSQYLTGARNLILGGDLNFVIDTNLDKSGGNPRTGMAGSKLFRSIIDKSNLTDCFRYLYPNKKSATWVGTASNYGLVGTRIDIFYISSSNNDSIITDLKLCPVHVQITITFYYV